MVDGFRYEGGGEGAEFLLENSSSDEYQKLLELEEAMDPLWWKKEDTQGPKIGDADLDDLPEEHCSFEILDGKRSEAESISNGFRTWYIYIYICSKLSFTQSAKSSSVQNEFRTSDLLIMRQER